RVSAVDAADASGTEDADANQSRDGEDAADRRGADVAGDGTRGEIARTGLACAGVEPSQFVVGEPDADLSVQHADRCRDRAAGAHRAFHLEPDLDPVWSGEAVRDDCRLERDDGSFRVERRAHLVGELDELVHAHDVIGIAPGCWMQRAAASSARSGPPTIQPAASASPAPVESTTVSTGSAARSSSPKEQPPAPCVTIHSASTVAEPTSRTSSSFAKTTSGAAARSAVRNASTPLSRTPLQDARSTLIWAPCVRASSIARSAVVRTGSSISAYPETWRWSQANHAASRSPAWSSVAVPRSDAMERSPSGATSEQIVPFLPPTGPATWTPRAATFERTSSPVSSAPVLPTNRASTPSSATHAATLAACPPGPT